MSSSSSSSSSKGKEPEQCCADVEPSERCPQCKEEHRLSDCNYFRDIVAHIAHIGKLFAEISKDYEHDEKTCKLFKNTANNLERLRVQFAKFK